MDLALEVSQVSYTYPDGTRGLSELTLSIKKGECAGIIGPSGSGKSTLGMCLVGLFLPTQGKILIDGIEFNHKNFNQIRKKVGLIFQNPDDQLFMPTVFADVAFGLLQQGNQDGELSQKVRKALSERGLLNLEQKFPGHLSQGEKRLAALAGVMAMEPELLILDEPSSNLDPKSRRNLIEQLKSLSNTRIILSHDLGMILELSDRVILLYQGRKIAEGPTPEILSDQKLMLGYGLEVPISLQLK